MFDRKTESERKQFILDTTNYFTFKRSFVIFPHQCYITRKIIWLKTVFKLKFNSNIPGGIDFYIYVDEQAFIEILLMR